MVVFNKCEEEFDWLLADDDEGKASLLGDVPINAMGKNIVICVYRQLHPFL